MNEEQIGIPEEQLEDKRHEVLENCFIEMDITLKVYQISFGEDFGCGSCELVHSTLAYIMSNHENNHTLHNVDIDEFSISESPFKSVDGEWTDKIYSLSDIDKVKYMVNMVLNSKDGVIQLANTQYFEALNDGLIIEGETLIYQLLNKYDELILWLNNLYSKLYLKQNQ